MADQQTILIVDDEPMNIKVLANLLQDEYRLLIAKGGAQALEMAQGASPPDLILLDIMMPDMDGYEVCRRLKEHPVGKEIPIIFATVKDGVEDEEKGLELGAVDYITKPYCLPVVSARVRTHLRLKRKTDLLEKLVSLDGLTEIPNRRAFDEAFEKEWGRAARGGSPLSCAMIDVDHFKAFNDHYGHGVGDECLKSVAAALAETLSRPGDFLARYGGEEFVAVLSDTAVAGAMEVGESLRAAVEALAIPHAASSMADRVTVSVGVATAVYKIRQDNDRLKKAADDMLYEAKAAGRNTVRSAALD